MFMLYFCITPYKSLEYKNIMIPTLNDEKRDSLLLNCSRPVTLTIPVSSSIAWTFWPGNLLSNLEKMTI